MTRPRGREVCRTHCGAESGSLDYPSSQVKWNRADAQPRAKLDALSAKLHELIAHRSQLSNANHKMADGHDDTRRDNQGISGGGAAGRDFRSPARTKESRYESCTAPRLTTMRGTTRSPQLECPHANCQGLQRAFTRQQDLVRHFATRAAPNPTTDISYLLPCLDYSCNEFCQYCSTLFTQASKSHKTHRGRGTKPEKTLQDAY